MHFPNIIFHLTFFPNFLGRFDCLVFLSRGFPRPDDQQALRQHGYRRREDTDHGHRSLLRPDPRQRGRVGHQEVHLHHGHLSRRIETPPSFFSCKFYSNFFFFSPLSRFVQLVAAVSIGKHNVILFYPFRQSFANFGIKYIMCQKINEIILYHVCFL